MKKKELQQKSLEDLVMHIDELKEDLHEKSMNAIMGNLKKTAEIRNLKREIARSRTLIAQKQSATKPA